MPSVSLPPECFILGLDHSKAAAPLRGLSTFKGAAAFSREFFRLRQTATPTPQCYNAGEVPQAGPCWSVPPVHPQITPSPEPVSTVPQEDPCSAPCLAAISESFGSGAQQTVFEAPQKQSFGSGAQRRRRPLLQATTAALASLLLPPLWPEQRFSASAGEAVNYASEKDVREAVKAVLTRAKCPGALRLVFHDAGTFDLATRTGGMNGSVRFELDRPESNGLKKYVKLVGKVREDLAAAGKEASWADVIAVAGAEAVEACGGPHVTIRMGRLDSSSADAPGRMPAETFNADEVISSFRSKGFDVQETVALLGAHTLGAKGFGDATSFDNSYFSILLAEPWNNKEDKMAYMIGLPSDRAVMASEDARQYIQLYADNETQFFADFSGAYLKLVDCGATWRA